MKDRSDDSSRHERTLLPRSYISLLGLKLSSGDMETHPTLEYQIIKGDKTYVETSGCEGNWAAFSSGDMKAHPTLEYQMSKCVKQIAKQKCFLLSYLWSFPDDIGGRRSAAVDGRPGRGEITVHKQSVLSRALPPDLGIALSFERHGF